MAPKLPERYQTQVRLGRDGDVEEWLATDTALDRPVLIRSLDASASVERRRLYAGAVRDAARVAHMHLAKVYEVADGSGGDTVFSVLEWNGGVSIADRLHAGDTLPVHEFLPNASGLAEALAALHAAGVIHGAIDGGAVQFSAAHPAKLGAFGREPVTTTAVEDTRALAATLRQAITGSDTTEVRPSQVVDGLPRSVDDVLAGAEAGAVDAAQLATVIRAAPYSADLANDGAWSWRWLTPAAILLGAALVFTALGLTVDVDPGSPLLFPATPQEPAVQNPDAAVPSSPPDDADETEVIPVTARSYDPFGDNRTEGEANIPLIHDGDRTTTWRTERYFGPLSSLKPGVGVMFTPADVPRAVRIIGDPGISYEIGWAASVPDDLDGWEMVATGTLDDNATVAVLPDRDLGVWLLWLTSLPGHRRGSLRGRDRRRDLHPMSDASTDQALVERYLAGDMGAFDELVRTHQDRVFATCLRMLRHREAALDATQDTFVTLFRKADRFRGEAAFTTWLYRVTMNVCYDHLRRAQRKPADPLPEHHDQPDPRATADIEAVELRPAVERALAGLPDEFRAAIILVDLQGLALDTAAAALEVPVGTVKSRLFRGRRLLAEQLGNLSPPNRHPTEA